MMSRTVIRQSRFDLVPRALFLIAGLLVLLPALAGCAKKEKTSKAESDDKLPYIPKREDRLLKALKEKKSLPEAIRPTRSSPSISRIRL